MVTKQKTVFVVIYKEEGQKPRVSAIHKTKEGAEKDAQFSNENKLYNTDKYYTEEWLFED
ncbi:MAG: hypothetical protein PVF17_00175 [Ignavibacteria bacterium]|jgi:hypothetical protein